MMSKFNFATAKKSTKPGIVEGTRWIWKKHKTYEAAQAELLKLQADGCKGYEIIVLPGYDLRGNYAVPRH